MKSAGATWVLLFLIAVVTLASCHGDRVRAQSRYFYVHRVALFTNDAGEGQYLFEFQTIRKAPALSIITVTFDRPGYKPLEISKTIEAGERRFEFTTPVIRGFEPGGDYWIRVKLVAPDRFTLLDRLRQRVSPLVNRRTNAD